MNLMVRNVYMYFTLKTTLKMLDYMLHYIVYTFENLFYNICVNILLLKIKIYFMFIFVLCVAFHTMSLLVWKCFRNLLAQCLRKVGFNVSKMVQYLLKWLKLLSNQCWPYLSFMGSNKCVYLSSEVLTVIMKFKQCLIGFEFMIVLTFLR